jgi:ribosomal-protein-alanine acetyltransferase
MRRSVVKSASTIAEKSRATDAAPGAPAAGPTVDGRPLSIAVMTVRDVPEVAHLEKRVFPDPWSVDSFLSEVERRPDIGHPLVVRDADGVLVAYAVVWFIVDEVHIGNLAVHPQCQGRGVGTFLLRHVFAEGRRRGFGFATLEVRPSNAAALRLYERFGFRKVAVRKRYYRNNGEDAHVLAAAIPAAEASLG